jgi:hypothetical protein
MLVFLHGRLLARISASQMKRFVGGFGLGS